MKYTDRTTGRRLTATLLGPLLVATFTVVSLQVPAQADHLASVTWGAGGSIIARDWEHTSFSGPSATRTHVKAGCTASGGDVDSGGFPGQFDVDAHGTLASSSWNDEISSFQGFGSSPFTTCISAHWDFTNCDFGGVDVLLAESASSMAEYNDVTSCIWWT